MVRRTGSQPPRDFLALTQREREERTPPYCRSNPTVTRHQTTNGGMFFAKSASDLMQRLPRLPTTPHVALLLRGKPKPFPFFHKHHLWKQPYTRWCCIDRLNRHDKSGPNRRRAASLAFTKQLLPLFSGSAQLSLVEVALTRRAQRIVP